ncbi:glycosyltransferase [Arthrobacter sp. KK5.5]|uniref:glycosyltransferase n=1 Tax=Arthrobacter sp. KK5.5 TaxID=3373084 RepID=UPI003EE7EE36
MIGKHTISTIKKAIPLPPIEGYSDQSPLNRAVLHRSLQDVDGLADDYLRLRRTEAEYRSKIRALENEVAQHRAATRTARDQLAKVTKRRDRLQVLLDRQTARVDKYKSAYEELRSIPHLSAATALLQPQKTARRLLAKIRDTDVPAKRVTSSDHSPSTPDTESAARPQVASGDPLPAEQAPTLADALLKAKASHFVDGEIQGPASDMRQALACAFEGELAKLSPRDRSFVEQLESLDGLFSRKPDLAPAQSTPAFLPVRGRVMYCAHSTGRYNSNGYSTRTAGLVQALAETGSDVFVAARPGYPWDAKTSAKAPGAQRFERDIDGVRHVFNPGPNWSRGALDLFIEEATDVYVREALINRPSVIHSASNHVTALPALRAARRLGLPFVYEVRGLWEITEAAGKGPEWLSSERFELARDMETMVAASADSVLAITEEVQAELVRRGVSADNIRIVPNAADIAQFVPVAPDKELSRSLNLRPGQLVVGYAGSVLAYEGLETLVAAHGRLVEAVPDARLVIVGDGPVLNDIRRQASELGLDECVTFTGRVASSMIPRYLSLFDIVPCPRISNLVTEMVSPLKPLESMAAGRVVVAADVAPLRHVVGERQERGLLFEAGSATALADAMIALARDGERRADLGRTARAWVAAHRSWPAIARAVQEEHVAITIGAHSAKGRLLAGLSVGIIADEFTTQSLMPECHLVPIEAPGQWQDQLPDANLDALIVESAWSGNGGAWHRGVGYYNDDEFAELRLLLDACRERGIPTIFWNKEDPVHIDRFLPTAAHFDHVFTTDADCIARYVNHAGARTKTVASLPFFAQPALHNPLRTDRRPQHTIAYGGSYYGDRYAKRSRELASILNSVSPYGLTIYDRQVNHPGSPYQFPEQLGSYVRGGLEYAEMVKAYTSHPLHINVNSVDASPTMFSRRVMELAASGTPVISGAGRGVTTFFGAQIPVVTTGDEASVLAEYWMTNEAARNADAWQLHRIAYRAHLAAHRLTLMLRTAGLRVDAPLLPAYTLEIDDLSVAAARQILAQTHRPAAVEHATEAVPASQSMLQVAGISVGHASGAIASEGGIRAWFGDALGDASLGEDLARSHQIAGTTTEVQDDDLDQHGHTLLEMRPANARMPWFGQRPVAGREVCAVRRQLRRPTETSRAAEGTPVGSSAPQTILVAGHDLKFAGGIMRRLKESGHTVLVDPWEGHSAHDPEQSQRLLDAADAIFCEWSLGNAAWYAQNKRPGQRLTVRFHSQELFTPYPSRTQLQRIDETVFVGELVRSMAGRRFGYDRSRTEVVPNGVDARYFGISKAPETRFNLGIVGIVPAQKHLDRALDVLASMRAGDDRYQLFVKGKTPEDYPWMLKRPEEMAYYDELHRRIAEEPLLRGAVHFDGHGNDMEQWYEKIGVVLSVSDFESFHLTLADGAAAGALPVSLAWPGSEAIYPSHWLHLDVRSMAGTLLRACADEDTWRSETAAAREFVRRNFHEDIVLDRLEAVITGSGQADARGALR